MPKRACYARSANAAESTPFTMTIEHWLRAATTKLKAAGIETARLDCEVLLSDILNRDRSWLHANQDVKLDAKLAKTLDVHINKRILHIPLAYIRGKQEFYGREFTVSVHTLTPRPETETLVTMALDWLKDTTTPLSIVDVGTGSGCIIVSLYCELSRLQNAEQLNTYAFFGLDISPKALTIAASNARTYEAAVSFKKFDVTQHSLTPFIAKSTLITANLPYVPKDFVINLAASHEPQFAIYGGVDGLDYYRMLFAQLKGTSGLTVLTESLPPQHPALQAIAQSNGFTLASCQDFIQRFVSYKNHDKGVPNIS